MTHPGNDAEPGGSVSSANAEQLTLRRLGAFVVHPTTVVSAIIAMAVFIPYVARVANADSSIHPVSFLVAGVALALLIWRRASTLSELGRRWPFYALGGLVGLVALVTTMIQLGDHGKAYVVNQMLVPVALFAIVQVLLRGEKRAIAQVGKVVVVIGAVQTILGAVQVATQSSVLFATKYADYTWFDTMLGENRAVGTFDHSLVLALFLLVAICLTPSFETLWLRWGSCALLAVGILLSQSRLAMIFAGVIVMVLILFDRSLAKFRVWAVSIAVIGAASLALSPLGQSVLARFQNDQGSNNRRFAALEFYGGIWSNYVLTGPGLGSSFDLTTEHGLKSSLENPFLMLAVDIGLIWALIWFGMQVALALGFPLTSPVSRLTSRASLVPDRGPRWSVVNVHLYCAAIGALVFTQSFSSTATESASSVIVWLCLALLTVSESNRRARL